LLGWPFCFASFIFFEFRGTAVAQSRTYIFGKNARLTWSFTYESIAVSEALDQMDMFQVRLRIWGDTAERRHQFGAFKGLLSNSVAADKASATATANNINDGPAEESGRDSSIDELME
jgi:hypothetical protein